ncbi:MAG: hypothetical protein ABIO79_11405 [Ferruginibacter sp.]
MKKVISIVTFFVVAFAFNVSAQDTKGTNNGGTAPLKYELKNIMISSVKIKEGTTTVPVPDNGGSIQITKLGKNVRRVIYTDAAGKSTRLEPTSGTANGSPKPTCKCPIPDACFGTANKNIGMCICKPCDLSNGEETYTIGLLLPAVQKIRQAAARMK